MRVCSSPAQLYSIAFEFHDFILVHCKFDILDIDKATWHLPLSLCSGESQRKPAANGPARLEGEAFETLEDVNSFGKLDDNEDRGT